MSNTIGGTSVSTEIPPDFGGDSVAQSCCVFCAVVCLVVLFFFGRGCGVVTNIFAQTLPFLYKQASSCLMSYVIDLFICRIWGCPLIFDVFCLLESSKVSFVSFNLVFNLCLLHLLLFVYITRANRVLWIIFLNNLISNRMLRTNNCINIIVHSEFVFSLYQT